MKKSIYRKNDMNEASDETETVRQTHSLLGNASSQLTAEDREKVIDYAAWLAAEDTHNNSISFHEETSEYIDAAMRESIVKGHPIRTFAPFHNETSAFKTFTVGQIVFFALLLLTLVTGLIFFKVGMVIGLIAGITTFYIFDLFLMLALSLRTLDHPCEEKIDDAVVRALPDTNWPLYTVLCPLYHEVAVVPQFVRAMEALDYPTNRLQVLFLIEDHDVETRDAIRAMNLPPHFKIMTVPPGEPRTKPRACNFGLLHAKGDYVVIYDAEDIPDPLQLKKAVLVFANHDASLGCVQAKLNFYNVEQNILTRLFTAEYSTWFDLTLPGLQRASLALPLGGTSNHFRTATLGLLGAWDAFNVTEDCDLGLRLAHFGLKTAVLDSTTYEEANSQVKNWFRQRSRWIKGYMQTYLIHMRRPWHYLHPSGWRNFFSLQFFIGGKAAILIINPLMWLSLIMYIFFRPALNNIYQVLFPVSVLYMGSLCLIFGNFLYTYLHLAGSMKRGHYKIMKWALFMPFYWLLSSGAAFLALYQLIVKPHYWEKTIHGLHLKQKAKGKKAHAVDLDYELSPQLSKLNETQETLV
jgi:cellulose synthase/poly-beta-1,6-N-acetylglucosamine synthase-like glycosyltransferase